MHFGVPQTQLLDFGLISSIRCIQIFQQLLPHEWWESEQQILLPSVSPANLNGDGPRTPESCFLLTSTGSFVLHCQKTHSLLILRFASFLAALFFEGAASTLESTSGQAAPYIKTPPSNPGTECCLEVEIGKPSFGHGDADIRERMW